jgi:uncharacterized protein YecE (DUF72 family)
MLFYRYTTASTLQNWIAGAGSDFRFAAKAHQMITHFRRLKDATEPLRSFLQNIDPMRQAGKLGPILFQTPPDLPADTKLFPEFAQLLPRAYRFAFEFRHPSWLDEETFRILREHDAALCWAESEKAKVPKVATADFLYYRFHAPQYSQEELHKIAEELMGQGKDKEVFAYFKRPARRRWRPPEAVARGAPGRSRCRCRRA